MALETNPEVFGWINNRCNSPFPSIQEMVCWGYQVYMILTRFLEIS